MTRRRRPAVLFCVAAGPRLGFGHLVRCRVLADALDVPPLAELRGTPATRAAARDMGWLCPSSREPWGDRFDLIVIDDPSRRCVEGLGRRARHHGLPWISIDALRGPAWAVLHPDVLKHRSRPKPRRRNSVVVALGGGAAVRVVGPTLAASLRQRLPTARIHLAPGFGRVTRMPDLPSGCSWLPATNGLASALASTSVAVVAGGVTAYEACALRTPAVGLAVVPAQRSTLRALARAGALRFADEARLHAAVERATAMVGDLVTSQATARRLGRRAGTVVDGRGTDRLVRRVRALTACQEEDAHAA